MAQQQQQFVPPDRYDSTAQLFSILKNDDGEENLLPFDDLIDAMMGMGDIPGLDATLQDDPTPHPHYVVTTTAPAPAGPLDFPGAYPPFGADLYAPRPGAATPNPAMPAASPALPSLPSSSGPSGPGGLTATGSGADSEHTRAQGWGSNPSSDGDGGSGDSDGDMDADRPQETSATGDGRGGGGRRSGRSGGGAKGGASKGGRETAAEKKKRRQRNADQMESNRVAQQKYRQRKKQEQSALQTAVDMLTAQVAALKAVEVRNGELEARNTALQAAASQHGAALAALQEHSTQQAQQLASAHSALAESQAAVASQHRIILAQGEKLKLQEQVIASLKDRLKLSIDEAMLHCVPGTVCEKMVAAVKATLYGAKDVHGLQETLAQLPDALVTELCKNLWQVCKDSFPELKLRCANMHPPCSSTVSSQVS